MHITTLIESSAVLRRADRFFGSPDANQLPADGPSAEGLPGPAKEVIACSVVMVALAAIVVGLRTYCRAFLVRRLGKDDWAIIIALIFSLGNSVGMSLQAKAALGRHMTDLTKEGVILFFKEAYFTMISYNAGLAWAKIAILLLYLRLFGPAYPTLRKISWAYLVIVTLSGLWLVCCVAFFCWPIEASWDVSIKSTCLPRKMRWFLGPSLNIVTDLMIISLPLPAISKMHLPRAQKLAVSMAFATGFFVCIVSFIRLKVVIDTEHSTDPSWDNPSIAKWSTVELNLAIICPCIVTLRPLGSPARWTRSTAVSSHLGSCETPGDGSDLTTGGIHTRESRRSWFRSRSVPQSSRTVATTAPTTTSDPTSDPTSANEDAEKGDARVQINDVELGMMGSKK